MELIKVSAIIPFYNGVGWLCEAVQSVLDQTYKNIEIIVVNDGSKEDVSDFLAKYRDAIQYYYQENKGPAAARNFAISKATGKYLALLDSDDIWFPEKTERQVRFMEEMGVMWSHTAFGYWWPQNGRIKYIDISNNYGNVLNRMYVSFRISTPSVVINRKCFEEHPEINFPEHMRYAQDHGLFVQLAKYYPIGLVNTPLMKIRMRGTNTNSRALLRIQLNSNAYDNLRLAWKDAGATRTSVLILGIYKHIKRVTDFLKNKCGVKDNGLEKIAKTLWAIPYFLERVYTKVLIKRNNKDKSTKRYYTT